MSWHWKELIPVDRFTVRLMTPLSDTDLNVITLLYQPLIGSLASSLYITLYRLLEKDQYWCEELTHRQLMAQVGLDLQTIYEERKKLEGTGLLKTFKKSDQGSSSYLYQLKAPMSPADFFQNDVYSVFLYNRLGKSSYLKLRERFSVEKVDSSAYQELTYSFGDVFTSLKHSELFQTSETRIDVKKQSNMEFIQTDQGEQQDILHPSFDMELMKRDLSSFIVPENAITASMEKLILRLAFVYQIQPLEMSRIISQAMVHDEEIHPQELRKRAQEWYKMENGNEPPALGLKTQPIHERVMTNKTPVTEEEKVIHFFETTAPMQVLEMLSDGAKPAPADMKIVEALLLDHELNPGVVNVLIDYVMRQNDMKLPKALIEKIAANWKRLKIYTVPGAMSAAKKSVADYKNKASQSMKRTVKKGQRQEKLPDWLIKERKLEAESDQTEKSKSEDKKESTDNSDAKRRFEAVLKKLHDE
ncbi:replication initiation and membrane attachment family protein [Alkalihalobacillus pseudalcaliphilus]|uniref:replication initiation and membrane attachment family protein n=1 Tax=Alkalihalobacillus pseudalcaliphilus TaxID=79884 RepID=UPI00064DF884|nr:DnaD domain protein [Alkalihalobacillus pseudalcaliphilus]KMK74572.1 helicase DnaB [Alkalihalobacillus pseudalcaliphilus]